MTRLKVKTNHKKNGEYDMKEAKNVYPIKHYTSSSFRFPQFKCFR